MKKLVIIEENLKLVDAILLSKELNEKKYGRIYHFTKGRIEDPEAKRPRKYRYVENYAVFCYIDE